MTIGTEIYPFEEFEAQSGGGGGGRNGIDFATDDVGVAGDFTSDQVLRGAVIVGVGIGEITGNHPLNLDRDIKRLIGFDRPGVLGESEFGGDHVIGGRDIAHDDAVTRTGFDLFTVRQRFTLTEVDEIVL